MPTSGSPREPEFGEIGIQLSYSAEYRMDDNFLNLLQRNEIMPMPGNHILIENSFLQPFWNIKELIFDLQLKGYAPILAHPERYAYYSADKKIYQELHDHGCEFQINLLSLAGYYNKSSREAAEWLVAKHLVDYLGSDMHNSNHALYLGKYLTSKDFVKHIKGIQLKKRYAVKARGGNKKTIRGGEDFTPNCLIAFYQSIEYSLDALHRRCLHRLFHIRTTRCTDRHIRPGFQSRSSANSPTRDRHRPSAYRVHRWAGPCWHPVRRPYRRSVSTDPRRLPTHPKPGRG